MIFSTDNPDKSTGMWCAKCGRAMRFNVPRLGHAGGYVHNDTHRFDCDLLAQVEHYCATATKERIDADLKAANFDHYQNVGEPIILPPHTDRAADNHMPV